MPTIASICQPGTEELVKPNHAIRPVGGPRPLGFMTPKPSLLDWDLNQVCDLGPSRRGKRVLLCELCEHDCGLVARSVIRPGSPYPCRAPWQFALLQKKSNVISDIIKTVDISFLRFRHERELSYIGLDQSFSSGNYNWEEGECSQISERTKTNIY